MNSELVQDLRNAIKLLIGQRTCTPWRRVSEEAVDSCVADVRRLKVHEEEECLCALMGKRQ